MLGGQGRSRGSGDPCHHWGTYHHLFLLGPLGQHLKQDVLASLELGSPRVTLPEESARRLSVLLAPQAPGSSVADAQHGNWGNWGHQRPLLKP